MTPDPEQAEVEDRTNLGRVRGLARKGEEGQGRRREGQEEDRGRPEVDPGDGGGPGEVEERAGVDGTEEGEGNVECLRQD
jgi:hypothetical protein